MQVKHIVLAVAAAIAAPSAMAASLTATNVIYISGASAQTPGLAKSIGNFCNTTVSTYTDDKDGKQGYAYVCSSAKATSGLTAGSSFIVVKLDAGGSANGVAPVVNLTTLPFPDIANCSATVIAGYNASNTVGTVAGSCAYNLAPVAKQAQLGLSDVPASVWKARGQFTPVTTAYTTAAGFAGQGFGIAVSPLLYTALQNDQIAGGSLASTCTGVTTAGACQPSISKAQYANIVASNPGSVYQQNWAAMLPNTVSDPALTAVVTLARRTASSGTQASSDVYFLNAPCETLTAMGGSLAPIGAGTYDAAGVLSTAVGYSGIPAFVVSEESSTGNVKTKLATGYAIGVMSLENAQGTTWKWLKLNGVSPNVDATQKATTVNGLYDFAYETEMIYRNDAVATTKSLATALVNELGNGANLATFSGIYADPLSGAAYVAGQTHKGSRGNNVCQSHVMFF